MLGQQVFAYTSAVIVPSSFPIGLVVGTSGTCGLKKDWSVWKQLFTSCVHIVP